MHPLGSKPPTIAADRDPNSQTNKKQRMYTKSTTMVLGVLLIFGLCACSGDHDELAARAPAPTSTATATATPTADSYATPTARHSADSAEGPSAASNGVIADDTTLFDIGGREIYLDCAGDGSPTVVVEAGLGDVGWTWVEVQHEVASDTRLCWVSRAGLGLSDRVASSELRTAQDAVDDLAAVLAAAAVEPPYVMVGHSFGGFIVRLFADQHREDVVGMVLVDSSLEDQLAVLERRVSPVLWREVEPVITALMTQANRENMDIVASAHEVSAVATFGDLPLIVLTAGEQGRPPRVFGLSAEAEAELFAAVEAALPELQLDLAAQSTRGEQRTIDGAGHFIHVDEPAAVVDAIKRVLSAT